MDTELSTPVLDDARKMLATVLLALNNANVSRLCDQIGESDSTISRFKSNDLALVCKILAALGLRVVSVNDRTVDPRYVEAVDALMKVGAILSGAITEAKR